ncbi:excinuclease ABC subunit UvrC [Alicyclobacillus fastidiosus]|uniref:UvrABC system protein C n=1 Tax=Alicyclobacillus fastidiosus TaxID=392011 RepID=A0ABY6ZQ39_9BACL|nr:excinuclease ABC subunit UvrC [Alicyclobacillus fastidiosus]WAH44216.1 excinuclease ABC subunit UvrC [Alicyclobacillus fastidiosus]GMA60533.1 UvrABC system protein C [Alicyclobacillus fastidiosus]
MEQTLSDKLALLPAKPGVYLMKGQSGEILYVGKAKVLKNRVRSYFTGSHDRKTQALVANICDFEYIVTDTVAEALILECNLIKQHTPPYNIMLRDDKTYPYIKITNEMHPRLQIVRRVKRDGAKYFGPYPSAFAAQATKRLLDRLYPLRKCKTLKKQVCLYYHINQCLAPCEFVVEAQVYQTMVKEIAHFLAGGHHEVVADLRQKMERAAEELKFERASELRDLIRHIEQVMEEQKITTPDQIDRDVFGFSEDRGLLSVQVFFVRAGKLIERSVSIMPHFGEPVDDFVSFVEQFYHDRADVPREVLLPEGTTSEALVEFLDAKVIEPKRGQKRDLVNLATKNARQALDEKLQLMERNMDRTLGAVLELGDVLAIGAPRRIESFDNSNIQGADAVAAMVVFIDGKPAKSEYRKFKIKTVEGPDDYASMREVIRRRYSRMLKEQRPLPDLIVIDGGRGQLSAALDVLENELGLEIPVCGLAKDSRHKTSQLFFMDEESPVHIDRHSQAFYLLERVQEEVHRFAITFHRQTRKKSGFASVLDEIPGVGPQRRKVLMKHFGSVKAIAAADVDAFRGMGIGDKLAEEILRQVQTHLAAAERPT